MGKATELKNTTELVKELLRTQPATRNSDDILYISVCRCINPIAINLSFADVLLKRKEWGIPPFESVRRARQKVQAENPELAANSNVEGHRTLNEMVFREYAKGKAQ